MVNVIQQAIEALEEAQTGLAWYRDRNPDQSDGSDDEAALRIEHAIHNLRAAQEGDLPLLPEKRTIRGNSPKGYAPRDMQAYARTAIAAAGGGVPQRESLVAAFLSAMEWGRDHWASFSMRGQDQREIAEQFADKVLASSPQPEAAPAVAQVPHHYRKKPVVIEAHQWDGTESGIQRIKARFPALQTLAKTGHLRRDEVTHWRIGTLEGGHEVSKGDWIIKGIKGEFYPCKPDIFAATYEAAPEAPAQAAPSAGEVERGSIKLSTYAWGVSRMDDNPKAVLVSFRSEPTDDDLRTLHEALRPASGQIIRADAALSHKEPQR